MTGGAEIPNVRVVEGAVQERLVDDAAKIIELDPTCREAVVLTFTGHTVGCECTVCEYLRGC